MKFKIVKKCYKCKHSRYEGYGDNFCTHPMHRTKEDLTRAVGLPDEKTCKFFKRGISSYITEFFRYLLYLKHVREFKQFEKYKLKNPEKFISFAFVSTSIYALKSMMFIGILI